MRAVVRNGYRYYPSEMPFYCVECDAEFDTLKELKKHKCGSKK